jgi:hypothetical protein
MFDDEQENYNDKKQDQSIIFKVIEREVTCPEKNLSFYFRICQRTLKFDLSESKSINLNQNIRLPKRLPGDKKYRSIRSKTA